MNVRQALARVGTLVALLVPAGVAAWVVESVFDAGPEAVMVPLAFLVVAVLVITGFRLDVLERRRKRQELLKRHREVQDQAICRES